MGFLEGVFGDDVVPGVVGTLSELVVVAGVGGVVFVLNKIEVASHDQVHVIGDAGQQSELLGAAAMVVLAGGEVYVEQTKREGGATVSCSTLKAEALGLALEVGTEWFTEGAVVVSCGGREHDESAPFVVGGVVVEDAPEREGSF